MIPVTCYIHVSSLSDVVHLRNNLYMFAKCPVATEDDPHDPRPSLGET